MTLRLTFGRRWKERTSESTLKKAVKCSSKELVAAAYLSYTAATVFSLKTVESVAAGSHCLKEPRIVFINQHVSILDRQQSRGER